MAVSQSSLRFTCYSHQLPVLPFPDYVPLALSSETVAIAVDVEMSIVLVGSRPSGRARPYDG